MDGPVLFAVYGEVGGLVGPVCGEGFVDVDAEAGGIAGMHEAGFEFVGMGEDGIGIGAVGHVFLNAKIVDAEIEVKSCGHADGTEIGGSMRAGADLIEFGKVGDFF